MVKRVVGKTIDVYVFNISNKLRRVRVHREMDCVMEIDGKKYVSSDQDMICLSDIKDIVNIPEKYWGKMEAWFRTQDIWPIEQKFSGNKEIKCYATLPQALFVGEYCKPKLRENEVEIIRSILAAVCQHHSKGLKQYPSNRARNWTLVGILYMI